VERDTAVMSRWLKNVGQFLDKLDDTTAVAISDSQQQLQEQEEAHDDEQLRRESSAVFERLSSRHNSDIRGAAAAPEEEEEDYERDEYEDGVQSGGAADVLADSTPGAVTTDDGMREEEEVVFDNSSLGTSGEGFMPSNEGVEEQATESIEPLHQTTMEKGNDRSSSSSALNCTPPDDERPIDIDTATPLRAAPTGSSMVPPETPFMTPAQGPAPRTARNDSEPTEAPKEDRVVTLDTESSTSASRSNDMGNAREQQQLQEKLQTYKTLLDKALRQKEAAVAEANRESRTLRRHMITLNEQLEAADKEIEAQRRELDGVAVRLENDERKRREVQEAERARHAQELQQQKERHDRVLAEQKGQLESRVEDLRKQLALAQFQLQQEGGERNKELYDAATREQDMKGKIASLEDEKDTLLTQIATLQSQQTTLASRLESLTQTADSALAREREAEERLDDALSLHARQVSQRQARETALEKTVAELGAALVAERSKPKGSATSISAGDGERNSSSDQVAGDATAQQHQHNQEETASLRAQLEQEREQNEILRNELRSISNERSEEAMAAHTRQHRHNQEVSDLSQQIAKLKAELKARTNESSARNNLHATEAASQDAKQVQSLSEEVIRQRDKLSDCHSEIATLRTRLHTALNRATVAEAAAEADDPERGLLKHRRGGRNGRRKAEAGPSMRTALLQGSSSISDGTMQRIGKSLDVVDEFVSKSGKVLRSNPIARLFFGM